MLIKTVTIKSNGDALSFSNFNTQQFHTLISEMNRLNPKAQVSITINVGQAEFTAKQNKKF